MEPTLRPDARHEAELKGVIDGYLADIADAHWRTLAAIRTLLAPDETLTAAGPCFHGRGMRVGLLFITDQRLIWIKQTYISRHPKIVVISHDELMTLDGYFETGRRWSYLTATCDRRFEKFSLSARDTRRFEFVRPVLDRVLGEKYREIPGDRPAD